MKTQYQIEMDYNKAIKQAQELEKIAKDLTNLANKDFETTLSSISKAWKGDSSVAYIKKGGKVQEDILKRAKSVKRVADTLREIAKNTRQAELDAYNLAKQRTYNG